MNTPELVDEKEAAKILNVSIACLQRWRWAGAGPTYYKIGRSVRYDKKHELPQYIASQARSSTSDSGGAHA